MLKAEFLLTWPKKKPERFFAVTLQLDVYIHFSEDVCCTYTFYSLMMFLMDMLGMLIRKIESYIQCIFRANCALKIPIFLTWPYTINITMHCLNLLFNHSHAVFFYNFVLFDWYDTDQNTLLTLHFLILRNLHLNDL